MIHIKQNKVKCLLMITVILTIIMTVNAFAYYDCCDCFVYVFGWEDNGQSYSETVLEREIGGYDRGIIQPGERLMTFSKDNDEAKGFDATITFDHFNVRLKGMTNLIGIDDLARRTARDVDPGGDAKVTRITEYFDHEVPGSETASITSGWGSFMDIYTFDKRAYFETSSIKSPADDAYIKFWEAFEVTVTDDGHGSASSSERYGKERAKASLQAVPDDGYQFKEWQVVSGKAVFGDEKSEQTTFEFCDEDTVVKAVFEKRRFNVTMLTDGCGEAGVSESSALFNSEISLSATPYEGYQFKEWQVLSGDVDIEDDSFRMPYSDVTLKAIFETDTDPHPPAICSITFDPNGGSVMSVSENILAGGTLSSLPVPVREGYDFKGWWTLTDGGDEVTVDTVFDRDTTVFAHWEKTPDAGKYKTLDMEGRKLNGVIPEIRLYYPQDISYDGKEHVAADLNIRAEGIPKTVSSDYIYGKTRYAISYYGLTFSPDTASDYYKAMDDKEKKRMEREIKKINRVLKKKKNRIYYAIKPLDLNEFAFDATKSTDDKKVFFRIDNSGDTMIFTKGNADARLQLTLSGNTFTVPKREYKCRMSSDALEIRGKNIYLIGKTVTK